MPTDSKIKPLPARPKKQGGPSLTFSDGLNFGCGFWVAGMLFSVVGAGAVVLALALLGMLGAGLSGLTP